jgi:hexosaminidase
MPLALIPWPAEVTTRPGALRLEASAPRDVIAQTHYEIDDTGSEGYRLRVDGHGIRLSSATAAGRFYGERTLRQLISRDEDGLFLPFVDVRDVPRFAYRGVMLDVARHVHAVETIERFIERAADLKFNALHLHLTDDQAWRLALEAHPELAGRGSATSVGGDPGGHYTASDIGRIVAHAAAHHMVVVPEIDLPGHTHAVGLSHPELVADPVLAPSVVDVAEEFGGGLPQRGKPYTGLAVGFSSLDARAPGLERFLHEVFAELAQLFPGPHLHFGGDEALGTTRSDYRAIVDMAVRAVAATGRIPVAWHEAGAADLPADAVFQYWGFLAPSDEHAALAHRALERGGRFILSPADADTPAGLTWANGPTSVRRSYEWDAARVVDVPEDRILGVEAALWTETIADEATLEHMVFPRIASAAEAAWSRPLGSADRDWESFRTRVAGLGRLWEADGIRFFRSPEIPWS